ncbi:GNAT family N-acetyltransferase [Pseudonocardia kunmingensis]|uniref:Putative acetyltransferase n=1 Tax=Pseudonocardia kunmingensis TaxID=630975 RepID=A0A543CYZ0_9PSEU|nr:N-acetyltransferase [Pseudonocardia kunmingensis]TQM02108.1 putative acetyltransferase [Pseudonocardia kunmingensis]
MIIRRELPGDEEAICRVHADAFAAHYPEGEPVEPELVTALRASDAWVPALSLVAIRGDAVVGHVCCTRATLGEQHVPVLGLGPLGTLVAHQRAGVGSALVHAVLGAADALDEPLVVLLGHPGYYPRFGFRPAAELGIRPEVAEWAPAFQARPLTTYRPGMTGLFRYAAPFGEL